MINNMKLDHLVFKGYLNVLEHSTWKSFWETCSVEVYIYIYKYIYIYINIVVEAIIFEQTANKSNAKLCAWERKEQRDKDAANEKKFPDSGDVQFNFLFNAK